jgi:hypothetical protein
VIQIHRVDRCVAAGERGRERHAGGEPANELVAVATDGSQRGLTNTWKLSLPASLLVKVSEQIARPLPRTTDQSPII